MEAIHRSICPYCSVGCGVLVRLVDGKPVGVEGDPEHPVNRGTLCAKGTMLVRAVTNPNRVRNVRYRAPGAARWEEKPVEWAVGRIGELIAKAGASMMVLGGTTVDNEDGAAIAKFVRAFRTGYDCHARLSQAAAYAALTAVVGKPAMNFTPDDLEKCRAIVVWGGNPADNHPVAMQWLLRAKEKGTKLIVIDPRLTRTAAVADLHVPLRCGTDLTLIGTLIREVFERGQCDKKYLSDKTDAPFVAAQERPSTTAKFYQFDGGKAVVDPSLKSEACVLRHVERRFSAYTPERAAEICGTPGAVVKQLLDLLVPTNSGTAFSAVFCGQGISQQGLGIQAVHGLALLQTLLGQIEQPGGGVYVLPAEANQRGALVNELLNDRSQRQPALLHFADRVSAASKIDGLIVLAENPAVCVPQVDAFFDRLEKLQWCVVVDEWETETAAFWRRPGAKAADIKTEAFLLPMAHALERDGSMTNAGGLTQRRKKVVEPPRGVRSVAQWLQVLAPADARPDGESDYRPTAEKTLTPDHDATAGKTRLAIIHWRDNYLPAYAEPTESPAPGAFIDEQLTWKEEPAKAAASGERVTAFIVRLGEHSQQGLMTRSMPWLVEMAPGPFVEISKSLARQLGIRHGETVVVRHDTRGEVRLPALVTGRLQPLTCFGKPVEQVAIVGQFGFCGLAAGPAASQFASLKSHHRGINWTPEQKPFLVTIEKVQ